MAKDKGEHAGKMFTGLPGFFYISLAWVANIYTVYAYWSGIAWCNRDYYVRAGEYFSPWITLCKLNEWMFYPNGRRLGWPTHPWVDFDKNDRVSAYANNLFWYALFMLQHSGMKSLVFKNKLFPVSERLERGLYVLCASFSFHMIFKM